jgi:hypothetical protein
VPRISTSWPAFSFGSSAPAGIAADGDEGAAFEAGGDDAGGDVGATNGEVDELANDHGLELRCERLDGAFEVFVIGLLRHQLVELAALEVVKGGAGIGLAAFLRRGRAENGKRIVTEGIGSGAGFGGIGEDVKLRRRFGRRFEGGRWIGCVFALCFCHWVVWVWVALLLYGKAENQ